MFDIDADNTIHITGGDIGAIEISAGYDETEPYTFAPGDEIRMRVYTKKNHEDVVLVKNVLITDETQVVTILLERNDTKLGEIINKPTTYWYEVELNPDTTPQTLIGYDTKGPKLFILYPEGGDAI